MWERGGCSRGRRLVLFCRCGDGESSDSSPTGIPHSHPYARTETPRAALAVSHGVHHCCCYRGGGAGTGAAGDERRRNRRAGAPLPCRPSRRRRAIPRTRLRARHVNAFLRLAIPPLSATRSLAVSCLFGWLVGALRRFRGRITGFTPRGRSRLGKRTRIVMGFFYPFSFWHSRPEDESEEFGITCFYLFHLFSKWVTIFLFAFVNFWMCLQQMTA